MLRAAGMVTEIHLKYLQLLNAALGGSLLPSLSRPTFFSQATNNVLFFPVGKFDTHSSGTQWATSSISNWERPGAIPWDLQVPLAFWGHCDDIAITMPEAHKPSSRASLNCGENSLGHF